MSEPEVVRVLLEQMRRGLMADPESLLEQPGAARSEPGDYVFLDLIGLDGELIDTVMVRHPAPPVYLRPIRDRLRLVYSDPPSPSIRRAEYRPTNAYAHGKIAVELLPGWSTDASFKVPITLLRYKRTL